VHWETLDCPHRHGRGYGKPCTAGFLVKNGRRRGAPPTRCHAWGGRVTVSSGTAYDGVETDPARCEMAGRAWAAGKALRATARIVQGDKDTVDAGLARVARPCRTGMRSLWPNLHGTACHRDEWWRFGHTKAAHRPGAQRSCVTDGDAWVWIACAPGWRVGLACVIGKRDQARADVRRARGAPVTEDPIPFFPSDPWPAYTHAWLTASGAWYQPTRPGARGATPTRRRRPLPGLV
jgi:hypothetical protein